MLQHNKNDNRLNQLFSAKARDLMTRANSIYDAVAASVSSSDGIMSGTTMELELEAQRLSNAAMKAEKFYLENGYEIADADLDLVEEQDKELTI